MWFFSSRQNKSAKSPQRSWSHRPRLEPLEDRCLLSGPGTLDPTFGQGGAVTTNFAKKSADAAWSVAVQADGKLVAAGLDSTNGHYFALARYNADGTPDSSFGTGGKVLTQLDSSTTRAAIWGGCVLQPDGKIVVGGTSDGSSTYELVRYNTNGTLDTTFGAGHTGIVLTSFAGAKTWLQGLAVESVNGGTKLVAGVYWTNSSGFNTAFALARYNLDGSLDPSFGVGGEVVTPVSPTSNGQLRNVATQPDGKILVVGRTPTPTNASTFTVARYDTGGNLDPTFGSGGFAQLAQLSPGHAYTLAVQPDGKVVAGGDLNGLPAVVRLKGDGSLDGTFGSGGVVTTSVAQSYSVRSLTLQTNGKIVAAENTNGSTDAVVRCNADGTLDTGFGSAGAAPVPLGTSALGIALQTDGKILVAGGGAYTAQNNTDFVVARYLGDPIPVIGSFTASAYTVASGSSVTLTASNLTDGNPGATVTQVAFYAQVNGSNTLLGYGTQSSPGVWTFSFTVNLAPGTYTLFAQATDNFGAVGDLAALTFTVQ